MTKLTQDERIEITDFIIKNYCYGESDRKYIDWMIGQHVNYKTLMVIRDPVDGIVAICRWNVLPTGMDAHIMDIVIHPHWRKEYLMKRMLLRGLTMYPNVKYLIFERRLKNKPFKKVAVKWLLKRRF